VLLGLKPGGFPRPGSGPLGAGAGRASRQRRSRVAEDPAPGDWPVGGDGDAAFRVAQVDDLEQGRGCLSGQAATPSMPKSHLTDAAGTTYYSGPAASMTVELLAKAQTRGLKPGLVVLPDKAVVEC
jgi:hypothetical protein